MGRTAVRWREDEDMASGFAIHVKVKMLDLSNVLVPLEREATRTASPRTTVKRTIHDIS